LYLIFYFFIIGKLIRSPKKETNEKGIYLSIYLSILLVGLMGLSSCQIEEDIPPQDEQFLTESDMKGMTKLGKQLENPYSVENMRKAYASIKSSISTGRIASEEIEIKTTHLYLKFKPQNEEELSILKRDSTLILFEYPMDHVIIESGEFYHDPTVPIDKPTYQYTAVKVEKDLPTGVDYEVLAELFIPDEKKDGDDPNGRIASDEFIDLLVDEALKITGNLDQTSATNGKIQARDWRPAGRIQLFDDELGRLVGVNGVKVRATRWFTVHEGYTNINGNYTCNGTFKRDANYSIRWERYDFDIRSGNFGQADYNGPKKEGNWNLEIRSGASRMYAIVFQACYDYYYGNRLGLKSPPQNSFWKNALKIAVWDEPNSDANGSHCKDCRFLGILSTTKIWNNGKTSMHIYSTTIHELAHASHWELRRNNWNFNQTEEKVIESWARGVQWAIGRIRYPNYNGGATFRPNYTQVVVDMIDDKAQLDVFGRPLNLNEGSEVLTQDDVTGYTIKQIEDVLRNTSTWKDWENNIKNNYNNGTEDKLSALFTHWN
jgi:hypothetical protein